MIKKISKIGKFFICMMMIFSFASVSFATSAGDASAFITKEEFDKALADFDNRLTVFEAGINSKIDSQVSSYLERNGIWNGVELDFTNTGSGDPNCSYDGTWYWPPQWKDVWNKNGFTGYANTSSVTIGYGITSTNKMYGTNCIAYWYIGKALKTGLFVTNLTWSGAASTGTDGHKDRWYYEGGSVVDYDYMLIDVLKMGVGLDSYNSVMFWCATAGIAGIDTTYTSVKDVRDTYCFTSASAYVKEQNGNLSASLYGEPQFSSKFFVDKGEEIYFARELSVGISAAGGSIVYGNSYGGASNVAKRPHFKINEAKVY